MSEGKTEVKNLGKVSGSMFNPRHMTRYTGTIRELISKEDNKYQILFQDGVFFFTTRRGAETNALKIGGKIEIVVISELSGRSEIISTRIIE